MTDLQARPTLHGSLRNILGATLMLAGVAFVAMNAQAVLNFNTVAAQHGGEVLDLGHQATPQPGLHGHMVRVVATPSVVEAPRDPEFNLSVATPVLTRHVEMFQWREVRIGDSTHYEVDWVDHLIDARQFAVPRGHLNPPQLPLAGKSFDAGLVQMGGFRLAPALQKALPGTSVVTPDTSTLPANLAATFSRHGSYLQTSANAANPQLGDVRVSWDAIPLRQMTVVARLDGDHLFPAPDTADGQGYQVAVGDVGLLDLFPDLPTPPDAIVFKRIVGLLLAALGAFVLLTERRRSVAAAAGQPSPAPRLHDVWFSLGLGALVVGAVAATVWAGANEQYMLAWIALALPGAALVAWQWRRRP